MSQGKVVQIIGAVVDLEFPQDAVPKVYDALKVTEGGLEGLVLEVQQQLGGGWRVVDEHHLEREYRFDDFRQALDFTLRVGEMAEEQGHHPDILLTWGLVKVTIWTHKIDGLSEADFVLAAKFDRALIG